jgi:hypothetical protein
MMTRSPGHELNPWSPNYKAGVLQTRPVHSVLNTSIELNVLYIYVFTQQAKGQL